MPADQPTTTDQAYEAYRKGRHEHRLLATHHSGPNALGGECCDRAGLAAATPHIAAAETARANKAERERDSLARRLGIRFGELEEARAALRQATDELDQLNRRPSTADQRKAQAALVEAWPDLAADPVHVEQLVAVALNGAYNPAYQATISRPGSSPATRTQPKPNEALLAVTDLRCTGDNPGPLRCGTCPGCTAHEKRWLAALAKPVPPTRTTEPAGADPWQVLARSFAAEATMPTAPTGPPCCDGTQACRACGTGL